MQSFMFDVLAKNDRFVRSYENEADAKSFVKKFKSKGYKIARKKVNMSDEQNTTEEVVETRVVETPVVEEANEEVTPAE